MLLARFLKFCVVGAIGVVIDFSITFLLKEKLKINKYIANSTGFICAMSSNYIINRIWTFQNHDPDITKQYMTFMIISGIGLAINNGFIYLFTEKFKMRFYPSKLFAMGLVTFWNFLMNYFFTFNG